MLLKILPHYSYHLQFLYSTLFFLLPLCLLILWHAWPFFYDAWARGEQSSDAGGLVRWPVKLFLPLGFALLVLQAIAELIKRIAFLRGLAPDPLIRNEKMR